LSKIKSDATIAGIGPRVVGTDGIDQSPHQRISFFRYSAWVLFKSLRNKYSLLRLNTDKQQQQSHQTAHYCYWVSGCFLLVRANYFIKAGKFDPETFLYSEEKILAERFRKIGKKFFFDPSVKIIHLSGEITNNHLLHSDKRDLLFNNDCYYYRKYRGVHPIFIKSLKLARGLRKKIIRGG
jgi:GT2 family glycosyltransferase